MVKKAVQFKVGDRVGEGTSDITEEYDDKVKRGPLRYDPDNEPEFGEVLNITDKGLVLVNWDRDYLNTNSHYSSPQDPSTLMLEVDVKATLSKLESEFEATEKLVKEKLKEAAKSIREAQKLAKKTGRNVSEMYEAYGTLYNAMDAAGWRTSSFGC
jgi:hypothetical protein